MIDTDGYRPNVGLIICNGIGKLLWAKRVGQEAWQFPQGGIQRHETPEAAMLRELNEEVGLEPADVSIQGAGYRLWREVGSFAGAGPDDRVYLVDRASGTVTFGPSTG
ncbi:MAG: NUDIX domain-containing protein, partial [Pseudomonadota bacterium]